jgi:hypothetical protein
LITSHGQRRFVKTEKKKKASVESKGKAKQASLRQVSSSMATTEQNSDSLTKQRRRRLPTCMIAAATLEAKVCLLFLFFFGESSQPRSLPQKGFIKYKIIIIIIIIIIRFNFFNDPF